ncbi:MAG: hypothetical protein R3175_14330 [Marinobacter sp.]|uniref:hypothetical protein n=1 Tax=Marinobacter sp. TaxID=50741 RepID=UPI00299D09F5|nr:hypothetical protein [Marinobacter sp.]MDX1757230.1 hypothetical protein [Marinobacter sp.]
MSWFKIFSAVVIGNIVSWTIISIVGLMIWSAVIDYQLETLFGKDAPTFQIPSTPPTSSRSNQSVSPTDFMAEQQRQQSQSQTSQVQQSSRPRVDPSVVRTNREMCEFWTAEYGKDGLEQSRKYKEAACARYRRSLN